MESNNNDQKYQALFMQMVLSLQTAAYQQMGKIKNPITDKIEKDLNQARFSIDMLEMFKQKTQGNLSEPEEQFLKKVISELQLNYVAEVQKPQEKPAEEKKEDEKPEKKEVKKEKTQKKAASKKPKKSDNKEKKK